MESEDMMMVKHVILWQLKDEISAEEKANICMVLEKIGISTTTKEES